MNDNNPYRSPQVETEQVESELGVAERSWAVHGVVVSSLTLAALLFVMTCIVGVEYLKTLERVKNPPSGKQFIIDKVVLEILGTALTICSVSSAALAIAGLSVWWRKPWGRIYAIILSYISILLGLIIGFYALSLISVDIRNFPLFAITSLIMFVYGIYVSNTLQYKKYKAEFISKSAENKVAT